MKKFLACLITILLIFQCGMSVYAEDAGIIKTDKITVEKGNSELVPVYIESNPGLMGFKLSFSYDIEKVEVKSVSRGTITSKGNFNTNFGIKDTQFDVVWNNTSQISDDGTLLILSVEAKSNSEIAVTYSQPDTFNESYQDVKLKCNNIIVNVTDNTTDKAVDSVTNSKDDVESEDTTNEVFVSNFQIIDAINIALEKFGFDSIEAAKEDEDFLNFTNQTFETIFGTDRYNVSDLQTLKSLYYAAFEGTFIEDVTSNISPDDINDAIDSALDTVGADSINEVKADEQQKFLQLVTTNLKKINPDTPNISEKVSSEKGMEVIEKLSNSVKNDAIADKNDTEQNTNSKNSKILWLIFPVLLLIVVIICIITKKLKRKQYN